MELTKSERSKITDGMHSIQSARASLTGVDEAKVPKQVQECLAEADQNLRHVLRQDVAREKK